jgi:hypothetical protein
MPYGKFAREPLVPPNHEIEIPYGASGQFGGQHGLAHERERLSAPQAAPALVGSVDKHHALSVRHDDVAIDARE